MRNLVMITTSTKEIPETNFLKKICESGRYLGKAGNQKVEARVSLGGLEEMEDICQLTNFITSTGLQPENFQGRGGFVKLWHFDKHFIKKLRKKTLHGKILDFFSLRHPF